MNYEYDGLRKSTTKGINREINYADYKIRHTTGITPTSKRGQILSSRSPYCNDKSAEFKSRGKNLSEERALARDTRSFNNKHEDGIKIIKTMKSISNASSSRKMRESYVEPFQIAKSNYDSRSKERRVGNFSEHERFPRNMIRDSDSPRKPFQHRHSDEPYRHRFSYMKDHEYESNVYQPKFSSHSRDNISDNSIEMVQNSRYINEKKNSRNPEAAVCKEDTLNFAQRIKARKENMRAREFEKIYKDSTIGNLKTPPLKELSSKN